MTTPQDQVAPEWRALRERIARRMWESDRVDFCGEDGCCEWETIGSYRQADYRRMAHIALTVIRTPVGDAL